MRVAVLSYPMLFQSAGGIKMKIVRTIDALNMRGVEARLVDPVRERLTDYDLVHVFACHQGNFRIIQQAHADGLPVVVSSILSPSFTKWDGRKAAFLSRLVGRLTNWEVQTTYSQIRAGLLLADRVVVMGAVEHSIVKDGYGLPDDRICVVPNGIGNEFFHATSDIFLKAHPMRRPFVLHVANIGEQKNQLGLVRALKGVDVDVVLVGYSNKTNNAYLQQCLEEGGERVRYLGELPHGDLLASAYSSAHVVAIPSQYEGMPNAILEGLAADRPVVMTNKHTMDLELPGDCVIQVDSDDQEAIRVGVLRLLENQPVAGRCRAIVTELSWPKVAEQLENIYRSVLKPATVTA